MDNIIIDDICDYLRGFNRKVRKEEVTKSAKLGIQHYNFTTERTESGI